MKQVHIISSHHIQLTEITASCAKLNELNETIRIGLHVWCKSGGLASCKYFSDDWLTDSSHPRGQHLTSEEISRPPHPPQLSSEGLPGETNLSSLKTREH